MPSARITCNFYGSRRTQTKPGGEQFSEPDRSQLAYLTSIPRQNNRAYILKPWYEAEHSGRAKTTSVIDANIQQAAQLAACQYLSLKFQAIQFSSLARNPITTTVQP
jgi:hypothetical protein